MIIHAVRPGESLYSIARQYGVSYEKVAQYNELRNPDRLVVGQTIVILQQNRNHTVAPGQSIYSIAQMYGVSVQAIIAANPAITNPSLIYPGQVLTIPGETQPIRTIEVNGYAFPGINMTVLRKTLPNLTYLSIFSYEVRPDGSLSTINDTPLITAAREMGVAPLMVITNIEQDGGFSSNLAHTILSNPSIQDILLSNVVRTLRTKNYHGLDIDFEYVYPNDKQNYNDFLRKTVNRLTPLGYTVTTALAPKISANQPGLLYEAHDYPVHGALASHIIIMTYEWGYTYGPPMAVAPLNQVRHVLNYAVTAIPSRKILMGIPNYGYDWTLPYTPGTAARTISNTGAVDLAANVGAAILFDPVAQAPYFRYYDEQGRQHIVWFEDARSIQAKLRLVNEYNLGGVSYWTIGSYFPQNWLVLRSMYNIRRVI